MRFVSLMGALVLILTGCAGDVPHLPTQVWSNVDVSVQARPDVIKPGANEFLVLATQRGTRKPEYDLIISLRLDPGDMWRQAIQDGHVGVYRRAMITEDPLHQVLELKIQRGAEQGVLKFPLAAIAAK